MAQIHRVLPASAVRHGQNIRASRCGAFLPLAPALSLGERVNPFLRGEQAKPAGFPLRNARRSLSLREKVRVRGNGTAYLPLYRFIPGTVEPGESSDKAGGFPK